MLLGEEETQKLKNHEGKYIATALFMGNSFIGFEEGYIIDDGIKVEPTGNYDCDMDKGGFISFVLITLGYAGNKTFPLAETEGIEKVYKLS